MEDFKIQRGHHLLVGVREDGTMDVLKWWAEKPEVQAVDKEVRAKGEETREFKRYTVVESVGPMFDPIGL